MPKYDYRCNTCSRVYEKREGFDAPAVQECQYCGAEARRVLTPPAIVFKGSGWYVNDSRRSSDSSDGASKESKPAADGSTPAAATEAPAVNGAAKPAETGKPASTSSAPAAAS